MRTFPQLRSCGVLLAAALVSLIATPSAPAATEAPRTFLVSPAHFVQMREDLRHAPEGSWQAIAAASLRRAADSKVTLGPWSVMDKTDRQVGPSGDKHDYVSMSSYWWPGPDGKYVWRDGQINPEMVYPDEAALGQLMTTVKTLATAGYLLNEDRYLERAAFVIRRWFLDPATRMNPNLNFAAGIPGKTHGRGIGLHRLKELPSFVDVIGLLGTSKHWSAEDEAGMRDWMQRYLKWALTSPLGIDEKNQPNNHAVYYGAHILAAALYVGDKPAIEEYSQRYFQKILIRQIAPDGELPHEMARTRPYNYTIYTLTGFCYYAELARGLGIDYYHHRGPKGQTLAKAFEWVIPFLKGEVQSPKPEEPMRVDRMFINCRLAALRCGLPFYEEYLRTAFPNWNEDERNLLWPPAGREAPGE